jgi:DNA-binding beta-propeller fold protein YncE
LIKPARASGLVGGGGHRKPTRILGVLLLAVGALLVLCPSAMALAERGHVLERSFGSTGSEAGQLKEPKGVAINEASGDVYVVDAGNNRIDRFDREGVFVEAWGWGVRTGAKALETCTTETKCRAGLAGHGKGQLHGAEAIAIDNAAGSPSKGDVYVEAVQPYEETIGNHEIEFEKTVYDKFSPTGKLEGQIKGWKAKGESIEPFEEPHGITVDSTGAVWIYNEESLFRFNNELKNKYVRQVESEAGEGRPGVAVDASGNFYVAYEGGQPAVGEEPPSVVAKLLPNGEVAVQELDGEESSGVAVGPATQDVFVDNVKQISVFDSSGRLIDSFGAGQIGHGTGVAAVGTGEPGASEVAVADSASNAVHLYAPEPRGLPKIDEASVAGITASSARLTALIDPTGFETEYAFRYSTEPLPPVGEACTGACHETSTAKIGNGFSDVSVEPEVKGLTAGTSYHYQVIARNSAGAAASGDQVFKTAPEVFGATLPDSRQWQMVSPPNKNGALIPALTGESEVVQASEDGAGITYVSTGALPGAEGSRVPEASQILSRRGASEWSSTDLDTPHEEAEGIVTGSPFSYRWFTPDLSKALVQPFGTAPLERPPLNKAAAEHTPYVRSNTPSPCLAPPVPEECFTPLVTAGNVAEAEVEGKKRPVPYGGRVNFVSATPDLSHSILFSSAALTEGAGTSGNLFEWSSGSLALVSILPGGEPAASPALGAGNANVRNAISEDGSRVIFTGVTGTQTHLYVRDVTSGKTAQLDEPQAGVTEPPVGVQNPAFQLASPDGSRIFFSDEQRLTKDSTASSKLRRPDLYECALGEDEAHKLTCTLHDLTVDGHAGESANVQGAVIGSSTDATTLYFVANGALTPDASPGNCRPGEESANQGQFVLTAKCNLYVDRYDATSETWTLTLVAQLSAEDEPDWAWSPTGNLGRLTSRVSPDGNWVTFMSDRSLTGYHNRDTVSGKLDEEVYAYGGAATANKVLCVSCNPNGARPTGVFDSTNANETGEGVGLLVDRPASYKERWLSGSLPGWTHLSISEARYASRALDNSGRVYFMSAEGLVPQDTNGKEDVYQYEPVGVGGCTGESETFQASVGGCVSLISSGKSPRESAFLDASPTGNDVFFVTAASLAPSDTDAAFDVYDASVCGVAGANECLPAPTATPKPCEQISECRTATNTPPPNFGAPPTSSTGASGNIVAPAKTGVLPSTSEKPKPAVKPLTRAQKLSKALKACRKLKKKSKRHSCETTARKRYGPVKKSKAKKAAASRRVGR